MNVSQDKLLSLKWNDFENNLRRSVSDCRQKNEFCDVFLLTEDLVHIQAHKLILSGSSGFFETIFQNIPSNSHPVIYLKGVKHRDLNDILSFIYTGEVGIKQDDLESFLAAAADLKIKGLTQDPGPTVIENKKPRSTDPLISQSRNKSSASSKVEGFNEYQCPISKDENETQDQITIASDKDRRVNESSVDKGKKCMNFPFIKSVGNGYSLAWRCDLCQRLFSSKKVAVSHVEMDHKEDNHKLLTFERK